MDRQPKVYSKQNRPFAASAAAVQAIIVNEEEKMLLLSSPTRQGGWQVVSGALDAGETILDGVLRETREEVGPDVRVRPLGVVHAQTFHYDANVPFMIGIYYLLAFEGGRILPGDDMVGSDFRWLGVDDLANTGLKMHVSTHPWMLKRAIDLYRLWRQKPEMPLQPELPEIDSTGTIIL